MTADRPTTMPAPRPPAMLWGLSVVSPIEAIVGLAIPLVGFVLWLALASVYDAGITEGKSQSRAAAVKAGIGRYVADPRTGETRFEWGK